MRLSKCVSSEKFAMSTILAHFFFFISRSDGGKNRMSEVSTRYTTFQLQSLFITKQKRSSFILFIIHERKEKTPRRLICSSVSVKSKRMHCKRGVVIFQTTNFAYFQQRTFSSLINSNVTCCFWHFILIYCDYYWESTLQKKSHGWQCTFLKILGHTNNFLSYNLGFASFVLRENIILTNWTI